MKKTIPSDGKKHRESQDYIPTGELFEINYRLMCSEAEACSIAKHFGKISRTDDGITEYIADGYYLKCPAGKGTKRVWRKERGLVKKSSGWKVQIGVVSDREGHNQLYAKLLPHAYSCYFSFPFIPSKPELQVHIESSEKPPVKKKLVGKERFLARKKRKAEAKETATVQ